MSPKFVPFELERWQSTWENRVRFNLCDCGVHPLSIQELLGLAGASALPLLDVRLGYAQSNGTDLLRERIAALYPGASPDQILVTTGSSEANFLTCWRLIEPGDKVAVMMPNYMQTAGLTQNFGAEVRPFQVHEKEGWEPYAEEIRTAIAAGTKLVVVTNPHNPTGLVLSDASRKTILDRAAEVGAWILADEVYRGAELDGKTTESFWSSGYKKLIIVNGLSKAYGLPGLRIGWIVSQPGFSLEAWTRHDYTTIGPSGASDHLASVALDPHVRDKLIERTRRILHANYPVMEAWLKTFGDTFNWHAPHPPRAAGNTRRARPRSVGPGVVGGVGGRDFLNRRNEEGGGPRALGPKAPGRGVFSLGRAPLVSPPPPPPAFVRGQFAPPAAT